jgi:hypothetical protein
MNNMDLNERLQKKLESSLAEQLHKLSGNNLVSVKDKLKKDDVLNYFGVSDEEARKHKSDLSKQFKPKKLDNSLRKNAFKMIKKNIGK